MTGLPDDVARFLYQHIETVEQLEVLLLARRSPGRSWSPEDMARELYSRPTAVAQQFRRLLGEGLVRESGEDYYQYAPRSTEVDQLVARLAELYRERRVAVISLIVSKPGEHLRAFSDAFRIRKKKEE